MNKYDYIALSPIFLGMFITIGMMFYIDFFIALKVCVWFAAIFGLGYWIIYWGRKAEKERWGE